MIPLRLEVLSSGTRQAPSAWYCDTRLIHRILRMLVMKNTGQKDYTNMVAGTPRTGETTLQHSHLKA